MESDDFFVDPRIERASTLPGSFYGDREVFERLREQLFASSWQVAGELEKVRIPGQVQPVSLLAGLLDEPLLLVRDEADELRCLSNVCTHRGNLLVEHPGVFKGLRCRYHGRRFGLDGRFQYMPECEAAEGFPAPSDDLPAVACGCWGPLVFASLEPPFPLEELLAEVERRLGWLPLQEFVLDSGRSRDYLLRANWALYCDNYLEGFHIPFVHSGLAQTLDYGSYTTETYRYSSLQIGVALDGEEAFDLPPSSPDHGRRIAAYYYWLFPNTMLNFYPWGLSVNIVKPLAVDRTRVSFLSFVWDESRLASGAGSLLDRVEREDEAIVETVQRGVAARLYRRGRFSPGREQGVHHFHRLLAEVLAR